MGQFLQSRYGSDRVGGVEVYRTFIGTSSERPIFEADKLRVETKHFRLLTLRRVSFFMDLTQLTVVSQKRITVVPINIARN